MMSMGKTIAKRVNLVSSDLLLTHLISRILNTNLIIKEKVSKMYIHSHIRFDCFRCCDNIMLFTTSYQRKRVLKYNPFGLIRIMPR